LHRTQRSHAIPQPRQHVARRSEPGSELQLILQNQDESFVTLRLLRNNRSNVPFVLHDQQWRKSMTKFKVLGAVCLAAALAAASPALARGPQGGFGRVAGGFHAAGPHFAGGGFRGGGFHRGGFGPAIAAGVIAGAALGATAGYGYYGDSYAYDDGYDGAYDNGYAVSSGYVCQPGTVFVGEDGRRHLCQ
jgi:hypothetical protein